MDRRDTKHLIYPWNDLNYKGDQTRRILKNRVKNLHLDDETLRDGLQSPSVRTPTIEEKLRIIHYINDLGIHIADIGLPAAGEHVQGDCLRIAREVADCQLNVKVALAGRTLVPDMEPMVDISQQAGIPVEAHIFIGSSMIRRYAEDWDFERMIKCTQESVRFGVANNLTVMYVTEDTTRAEPRLLKDLYLCAIENGASRICLSDTVGYATPNGILNLVDFAKKIVWDSGEDVKIDWHGHNDRGLGVANAMIAGIDAGVDRIHGTCLGIGERVGNTAIDQIMMNLFLMELLDNDLTLLGEYCKFVSQVCEVPIPHNYPAVGSDAFRTATGVHAAAIIKAMDKDVDHWLSDYVYSAVPAQAFGLEQKIEIGPVSGKSNIIFWLKKRGIPVTEQRVNLIFERAKHANHILAEAEIYNLLGLQADSARVRSEIGCPTNGNADADESTMKTDPAHPTDHEQV